MPDSAPDADSAPDVVLPPASEGATSSSRDSGSDSVESFAADLRSLRLNAGSPTLFGLQHATSISKTVISDALRGQRLPSSRTVDRLVRAMDADPTAWIARRDRLAQPGVAADDGDTPEAVVGTQPTTSAPHPVASVRRRTAVLLAVAAFAIGIAVSGGISYAVASTVVQQERADAAEQTKKQIQDSPQSVHAQINVRTGVDPALTPCVNDAKVVAAENRPDDTKLEIIWSNKCYAGWGRVTRYDGKAEGNSVTIAIYPETAPMGPDRQAATEPGVQSAYTTLVVRPSPQTRLCATGSITTGGTSFDLGDPICI